MDQYERGLRKGRLTQGRLAELVGVSRQTLWRSEEVKARLRSLAASGGFYQGVKRTSLAAQVLALRLRNGELEAINQRMAQSFIVLCRSLDELGLDPIDLMGESAPDLIAARRDLPWR